MKMPILRDFEKWKRLNEGNDFSLYDYIFHLTKLDKVGSDIYFAFLELFWPSFLVYKDYIILKENFSKEKFEDLIKKEEGIEYWMNLVITDPYFENDEDGKERAKLLAMSLVEIWQEKLKKDFPTRGFIVKYVFDEVSGDYGLTFYQINR